jgi:hypothetical protein
VAQGTEPDQLIGGRYRLLGMLGSGGFGRVWRARDETLRLDVAVKEVRLPARLPADERAALLVRAEREARNAARLRDHPHIVSIYDVVVDRDLPWIVMRLVDGRSLAQRLGADGPLPPAEAEPLAVALLGALDAAHGAGVVHRDVKPDNVLLTAAGQVLLADFGIAVHHADTALTASGMFLGALPYTAPERAHGKTAVPASDLFSLGVTLYEAVEGHCPFRRDIPAATLRAVLFDEPPPPRRAGQLGPLITALLAKDPGRRPSIAEALALLGASPTYRPPSGSTTARRPPESGGHAESGGRAEPGGRDLRRRAVDALAVAERLISGSGDAERVWLAPLHAAALAPLEPARAERLADRAFRAALRQPDSYYKAQTLASLADELSPADPGRAARYRAEAVATAGRLPDELAEAWQTALLAGQFPERAARYGRAAEQAARLLPDPAERVSALTDIAQDLAGIDSYRAEELIREANRATWDISGAQSEAAALTSIARALARVATKTAGADHPRAVRLMRQAERALAAVPAGLQVWSLPDIAAALAVFDPDRAEHLADTAVVSSRKDWVLAAVAERLAAEEPDRAERIAHRLPAGPTRGRVLASVSEALATSDPDRAERTARGIADADRRATALAGLARRLAGTDPHRAEHIARDLPSGHQRAELLARVAGELAVTDPDHAERLLGDVLDEVTRAWHLIALARAWTSAGAGEPARAPKP